MVVWSVNLRAHLHHFKILSMLTLATIRFFFFGFCARLYIQDTYNGRETKHKEKKQNGDHEMREESKGKKTC